MSRTNLILIDALFVLVVISVYATDGLKTYPVILLPLMSVAFATCIIRHINYYKITRRIF
ncbi:MAG: hypothetical protein ACTHNW_07530 [Mucilaginibacter sp.]